MRGISRRKALVGRPLDRPYSAALVAGDLVFVSGQVGIAAQGNKPLAEGTAAQTSTALDNIAALLALAGLGLDDIVKTTVFLTDMRDLAEMNEAYRARFRPPLPTRSTVGVAALARPELKIEIEAIALSREEGS